MENYSTEKINEISQQLNTVIDCVSNGVSWGQKNLKFEDKEHFITELKNSKRKLLRINNSIETKSSIAVFGGSQVGKSYLIKNILSESQKPFYIVNNQNKYDFLKEINPPGVGAESTGVVTRFTIDQPSPFVDFPIKIKILSVKDLLTILFDSFYLDQKRIKRFPSEDLIIARINEIEQLSTSHVENRIVLSELDILDIKQYFDEYLAKHSLLFERLETTKYWYKISNCIERIQPNQLYKVFSILWDDNLLITNVFNQLLKVSSEIDFESVLFAPFDSVLRGKGEILDVKRLKELNTNTSKIIVQSNTGKQYEIDNSFLSALTAELVFQIPEELIRNKSFIQNSDLLDFPGARSRLAIENEDISVELIPEMLLRGKVSYLFNKYSDSFQINNLLFCTNDKQLDVNEIPTLLSFWIDKNIGETSDDRRNTLKNSTIPPLFVVFTFFNNQLKYDTTNDLDLSNLNYKWDIRFNRFFENEIVSPTNNWHKEWDNKNSPFQNFYLLRDYKYSNDTYLGFENLGSEVEINPERIHYLNSLKNSFVQHSFVQHHFNDPENAWHVATSMNSDGTELIIQNLNPVSSNYSKISHHISIIEQEKNKLKAILSKHVFTDNLFEIRTNALRNAVNIQISLNTIFSINPINFNNFIKKLLISPDRLFNFFNEQLVKENNLTIIDEYTLLKSQFPLLSASNSKEQNIEILRRGFFLGSPEEVLNYLDSKGINIDKLFENNSKLSKTAILIDELIKLWKVENLSINNLQNFIELGISTNVIEHLIEHYSTAIERFDLKEKLNKRFEKKISDYSSNRGIEEYLSEISAYLLNDFILNFGIRYLSSDELHEIQEVGVQYNLDFKEVIKFEEKIITDQDLKQLFDQISDNNLDELLVTSWSPLLKNYNLWFAKLKISMLANCGFVNYDEIANNELKVLLSKFSSFQKLN
jgi:hypothetical protein